MRLQRNSRNATGVEMEVYTTDKPGEAIAQKYAAGDPATLMLCDYPNVKISRQKNFWI